MVFQVCFCFNGRNSPFEIVTPESHLCWKEDWLTWPWEPAWPCEWTWWEECRTSTLWWRSSFKRKELTSLGEWRSCFVKKLEENWMSKICLPMFASSCWWCFFFFNLWHGCMDIENINNQTYHHDHFFPWENPMIIMPSFWKSRVFFLQGGRPSWRKLPPQFEPSTGWRILKSNTKIGGLGRCFCFSQGKIFRNPFVFGGSNIEVMNLEQADLRRKVWSSVFRGMNVMTKWKQI